MIPATDGKPGDGVEGHALGDLVMAAAMEAEVDPFLLAGLMFVQSGCRPELVSPRGRGLLRLHPAIAAQIEVPSLFGGDDAEVLALSFGALAGAPRDGRFDLVRCAQAAVAAGHPADRELARAAVLEAGPASTSPPATPA